MPTILPVDEKVSWSPNEGVIGVVGVAPWATLDFCHQVYRLTDAQKDWHYPRIIVDANSKIPSRGRHLQLGERDPSPFIRATIDELAQSGATVAVVPCNTAHILFERWGRDTAIPVVSIIAATLQQMRHPHKQKVCIFGSQSLIASQLYQNALRRCGGEVRETAAEEQALIDACIASLKRSVRLPEALRERLATLAQRLRKEKVTAVLLACTELGLIKDEPLWHGISVIDSNEALAREALKKAGMVPLLPGH